ncbi:glycoside hydrolase family 3 C-terminal domain-containing protein [Photobacterium sp. ZSDE20]|uniref:Glycoside hydrolase family 3 C-terminal domain-containing protein n=1 Tax=Photobacterium pectinilyticum TaxID=2906793 RepID=A0ABT1MVG6_9GAMM|nr:glycoside hydrolase family 3 N-terminal domain-containing protein [Photobacterium sp. ZSDE20]MCQ1056475.1 glycoside hydrolase family 3 C-terminal domain-containing protein [Photobacterium sp. ZSDE20]MDD1820610.1 glycoside hydrolase family 3 C-terminal domain-containing protein [Photobacterium sp. ZSDE20]
MSNICSTPYFKAWPKIVSKISQDNVIEDEVELIINQMTLEEKIGQMIQPEIREITTEELKEYKIGSILNGGGAWPNDNKHASAKDWASKADDFWMATEEMFSDRSFRIPFIWATDAVHGHNNVFGATVFPHNIGLGCARDPELILEIGQVTAREIVATGLDWTFAPTVATPRDLRWGRVYEGYSEDPEITYQYAAKMVEGLQGDAQQLKSDEKVLSNVKHWVGDGGTSSGIDRGVNAYSEELLRNIHACGYFSGLEAGAQVVMSSFNSWENESNYDLSPGQGEVYNHKIHGSKYLICDVLKGQMGFDGVVVTDWHGHSEVNKCTDTNANYAINAGNDVLMVPIRSNWKGVIKSALEGVNNGEIPLSRIDDAVTRILRVKMRAGLWNKSRPILRKYAGMQEQLGACSHRDIARRAVRQSLVLLKNKHQLLPLYRDQRIILTGSAADDLQKQAGGWSLTWQGDENTLDDFPGASTVKMALEAELGQENVTYDPNLEISLKSGDVAIVVFGEDPYAEMMGDIKVWQTLEFSALKKAYKADCDKIKKLKNAGVKVISVFFSGRPLYLNEEIANSDAFIAAFLPGSEGFGITDLLLRDSSGYTQYDFTGKLSYSWPNKKRSATVNKIPSHIPNYVLPDNEQCPNGEHKPLFEYGYGLNYTNKIQDRNLDDLTLDINDAELDEIASYETHLYGVKSTIGDYKLKIADQVHWIGHDISRNNSMTLNEVWTKPYNYQQQQDAMQVTVGQTVCAVYLQTGDGSVENFSKYRNGTLKFEIKGLLEPKNKVYLSLQKTTLISDIDDINMIDVTRYFNKSDSFEEIAIPVEDIINNNIDVNYLDTPFVIYLDGPCEFVIANVVWSN